MSDTAQPSWDALAAAALKQQEPFKTTATAAKTEPALPVAKALTVDAVIESYVDFAIDLRMPRWKSLLHAALQQQKVWEVRGCYPSGVPHQPFLVALNQRLPPPFRARDDSMVWSDVTDSFVSSWFMISWAPDDLPFEEYRKEYRLCL
jgi:hypothetical protein